MRHDTEDRWLNLKKLQELKPSLTPEQRRLKLVLQILGYVFFAAVLFTCKSFSDAAAIAYTRRFFNATEIATRSF